MSIAKQILLRKLENEIKQTIKCCPWPSTQKLCLNTQCDLPKLYLIFGPRWEGNARTFLRFLPFCNSMCFTSGLVTNPKWLLFGVWPRGAAGRTEKRKLKCCLILK